MTAIPTSVGPDSKNQRVCDHSQQTLLHWTTFLIDRWFKDECEAFVLAARYSRSKCLTTGSAETPLPYDSTRRRIAEAKCHTQRTDEEAMAGPQIQHSQCASSPACIIRTNHSSAGYEAIPATCYYGSYSNWWSSVHSISG